MEWWRSAISRGGAADDFEMRCRKTVLVSCVPAIPFGVFLIVSAQVNLGTCGGWMYLALSIVTVTWGVCKRRFTQRFMICFVAVVCAIISMADLHYYQADLQVAWPAFVIVIDLILVLRLDHRIATVVVCFVVMWLLLNLVERLTRFGLYDVPLTDSYERRRENYAKSVVDCDMPPCKSYFLAAGTYQGIGLMVFLIDYIATRGFAQQVLKEQAAMQSTIATVETIASLLAAYDVDAVSCILGDGGIVLPDAMRAALLRLEQNLRAYRPYLPAVLLEEQQRSPDGEAGQLYRVPAAAPGADSQTAAIAFTDIRASTSIWEAAPEGMQKALVVHDVVLRAALAEWGGYEVKTIGDAFMVAFEDAHAAVCFGLTVQESLLASEWPAALLEVGICHLTELWGGLTVRIGVNQGPVTLETNTLTGRVDYFGHTVNVASRLESVCVPGAVALPAELWTCVRGMSGCVGAHAGHPVLTNLKGVSEPVPVCSVWPARLQGREDHPLPSPSATTDAASPPGSQANADPDSSHSSTCGSWVANSRPALQRATTTHRATVAVATLNSMALGEVDGGLACVVPLLQQSGGVLLSLFGNNFFVGWNFGKQMAAHAEGALRFAQRALQLGGAQNVATLGIASGTVEHGDVGTARQRFVTASGSAVEASLALRRIALSLHMRCLYTSDAPPGAVRDLLCATTARVPQEGGASVGVVYEVLCSALSESKEASCDNVT